METFISYLIKSSVWLSSFGVVYFLFLRHERFFRLNRLFLVAGLLSAILFPLITINYTVMIPQIQESVSVGKFSATAVNTIQTPSITWEVVAKGILLSGTLLFLVRMLIQTLKVIKTIRRSEVKVQNNLKVVKPKHFHYSFSFFSYIFVNPALPEREIGEIVAHEAAHVRQYHWIDLVLAELLCAFQWFNPMAWLYSHFIRQNHEYLADQSALRSSPDPAFYKATLINHLLGSEVIRLGHSFSYSLNKKRFIMMKNTSTSIIRKLKPLAILPVIAIIFYAFAEPRFEYERIAEKTTETSTSTTATNEAEKIEDPVTETVGSPLAETDITISGSARETISERSGQMQTVTPGESSEENQEITIQSGKKEKSTNTDIPKQQEVSQEPVKVIDYDGKLGNSTHEIINQLKTIETKSDTSNNGPGVTIRKGKGNKNNPLIFVDGEEVSYEALNQISPEEIDIISVLKDASAKKEYGSRAKNGVILITLKGAPKTAQTDTTNEETVFFIVEEMPKFPDGDEAMHNYINKTKQYPRKAKEEGIEGRVYVSFIITAEGKITNPEVAKGVHPLLDEEAKRVVSSMPNWKPGKQRGKNVAVEYTIPVQFEL